MEFFIWFEPIARALQMVAICIIILVAIGIVPTIICMVDATGEHQVKLKKILRLTIILAIIAVTAVVFLAPLADFQDTYNDSLEYQQKAAEAAKRLPTER